MEYDGIWLNANSEKRVEEIFKAWNGEGYVVSYFFVKMGGLRYLQTQSVCCRKFPCYMARDRSLLAIFPTFLESYPEFDSLPADYDENDHVWEAKNLELQRFCKVALKKVLYSRVCRTSPATPSVLQYWSLRSAGRFLASPQNCSSQRCGENPLQNLMLWPCRTWITAFLLRPCPAMFQQTFRHKGMESVVLTLCWLYLAILNKTPLTIYYNYILYYTTYKYIHNIYIYYTITKSCFSNTR